MDTGLWLELEASTKRYILLCLWVFVSLCLSTLFPIPTYETCLLTLVFYIFIVQCANLDMLVPLDYHCLSTVHIFSLICIVISSVKYELLPLLGKGKHFPLLSSEQLLCLGIWLIQLRKLGPRAAKYLPLIHILILLLSLFPSCINSEGNKEICFSIPSYILILLEW